MNYRTKAFREEASRLLKLGYNIVPALPGVKRPAVNWEEYYRNPARQQNIDEWWNPENDQPPYNIAVITGKGSTVILDIDPDKGRTVQDLIREAQLYFGEYIPDEDITCVVKTAGNGWQIHFRCDRVVKSCLFFKGETGKIELRAEKAIGIMPPSRAYSKRIDGEGDYEYLSTPEVRANWHDWWMAREHPWTKESVDQLDTPNEPDPEEIQKIVKFWMPKLKPYVRKMFNGEIPTDDRSTQVYNLGCQLVRAGVTDHYHIAVILFASEPHRDKHAKRRDSWDRAWVCAGRVLADAERPEKPSQVGRQITHEILLKEPSDKVYQGMAGEVVKTISPYSEADNFALLINFLVAFGNLIGRVANFLVGADRHFMNLFAVLVGETAKGRKGMSWNWIAALIRKVDKEWEQYHTPSGLSSGEGLIFWVRDPVEKEEPIKEKGGKVKEYQKIIIDEGVSDKRLLVMEGEFAQALKVMARPGNTLSPVIRQAYDTGNLTTLVKNNQNKATGAHISIIGHITVSELRSNLTTTEMMNGFGNRFLWCYVKRSKYLPDGATVPDDVFDALAKKIGEAVEYAKTVIHMERDDEARQLWHKVYPELSEGKPGLVGAMLARAEANVLRLSCIYALLDKSSVIQLPHLQAALGVWERCEQSAKYTFQGRTGNPLAEVILDGLREGPMTKTQVNKELLGGNHSKEFIDGAIELLEQLEFVESEEIKTQSKKPTTMYRLKTQLPQG